MSIAEATTRLGARGGPPATRPRPIDVRAVLRAVGFAVESVQDIGGGKTLIVVQTSEDDARPYPRRCEFP